MESEQSRRSVIRRRARRGGRGVWAKLLFVAALAGACAVGLWLYAPSGLVATPLVELWQSWTGEKPAVPVTPPPPVERARKSMTLYFAHPSATRLVPEERKMEPPADALLRARRLLEELARGPQTSAAAPVLPPKTRVRGVYQAGGGLLVVDLSREVDELKPQGVGAELLATFAIVHTLCENVESVKSVRLLVDGQEREALVSGVRVTEPLRPRGDLVSRTAAN